MHAATLALALLAPACAVGLTRRRADSWTLWLAHALVLTALMLLCCLAAPELSFVFVLPALATVLVAWPAARRAAGPAAAEGVPTLAIVVPVLVFAFALAPMLLLLYPALGTDAWPILTAVSALCLLGLAPLLRRAGASDVRSYVWLGLGVTVMGCGVALLCPAYSAQMPQRTLLWYALDADSGRARWVLQPDSKRAPPQLALHDDPATLAPGLAHGNHRRRAARGGTQTRLRGAGTAAPGCHGHGPRHRVPAAAALGTRRARTRTGAAGRPRHRRDAGRRRRPPPAGEILARRRSHALAAADRRSGRGRGAGDRVTRRAGRCRDAAGSLLWPAGGGRCPAARRRRR